MRYFILAIGLLLGGSQANVSAQVILRPYGGIGLPRTSPIGPVGFGTGLNAPIYPAGYGLGTGLNAPFYPGGYGVGNALILPGFGASTPARMRPTVYPAIRLPSPEVIAAKLAGADDNRASLTINLPTPNARLWLEGVLMGQTGRQRNFVTPPLDPGSDYVFQIQVEWQDASGTQTRKRNLTVSPGAEANGRPLTDSSFARNRKRASAPRKSDAIERRCPWLARTGIFSFSNPFRELQLGSSTSHGVGDMNRRLNAAFLIKFLAITLVLGVGIHLLHGFQIQRNARHFLTMAERSLEEGKLPQALTYFQHYLSIEPRDVAARVRYALVLDRQASKGSDRLRAILEMDKILAQDPQQEEVRYRLILNLIEMERVGQALIHVDKLLPTWSKPAELHHIRGWCLESLKKYPEAAQAFARAVELDPSRISSYELWAETMQRLPPREGDPEPAQQARAILDRMVQANEKDFQAYLARSRFLKESAAEESKSDLDQAARLAPDEPAVTLALAEWHLAKGDLKTARTVVEAGRAKHAHDAGLIKALAGLDIRAGLPDQAITLLRGEVEAVPGASDLTILLIELLIDRGHLEEAQTAPRARSIRAEQRPCRRSISRRG